MGNNTHGFGQRLRLEVTARTHIENRLVRVHFAGGCEKERKTPWLVFDVEGGPVPSHALQMYEAALRVSRSVVVEGARSWCIVVMLFLAKRMFTRSSAIGVSGARKRDSDAGQINVAARDKTFTFTLTCYLCRAFDQMSWKPGADQ